MKIKLLALRSTDLEKTKELYTSLGMEFVKEKHDSGPVHYSAEFDDFVLELYPAKGGESDNLRLGFEVPGLSEIVSELEILEEYEYNSTSIKVVKDPEGRKVELYEITPQQYVPADTQSIAPFVRVANAPIFAQKAPCFECA